MKTAVGLCTVAREGGEEEWEVREGGGDGRGLAALQTEPIDFVCQGSGWWGSDTTHAK